LCVTNDKDAVECLYTDGISGCVEVIFRNSTATFICHLFCPKDAVTWIRQELTQFEQAYGTVEKCYVAIADGEELGKKVARALPVGKTEGLSVSFRGYQINLKSGKVTQAPGYVVTDPKSGGVLTTPHLIARRSIDQRLLGEPMSGDFSEQCPSCRNFVG
jgi:hypothetical protein